MLRRPPRPTLFPTRRSSDLCGVESGDALRVVPPLPVRGHPRRSEEHTSELQSLAYLVCRLLPEKKNTVHLNDEYAATTQFKGCIAHGILHASFISTFLWTML